MSDWSGGYVHDIEYVPGFYREQSPCLIDVACVLSGVEPPRRFGAAEPFDYCELGCGQGTTSAVLAASNPQGRFVAVDLMPAHIARAEDMRRRAGLDNLTFLEADVADLADRRHSGLPQFDYITMHGLYSWVPEETRLAIVRFIDTHLKPGGVVYVSYNVLPGWAGVIPLQRLLFEHASLSNARSDQKIRDALAFANQVADAGSPGIDKETVNSLSKEGKEELAPDRAIYLAHEYLNGSWTPQYHADVARELNEARLSFAGPARLIEAFPQLMLSEEQRAFVEKVPHGPFRETLKDYFNRRMFRKDLFVRGPRPLTPERQEVMLRHVMLSLVTPVSEFKYSLPVAQGTADLNGEQYQPIVEALAAGPVSVGALLDEFSAQGTLSAGELTGMMIGSSQALPVLQDVHSDLLERCLNHNRIVVSDAVIASRSPTHALACPVGHAGIMIGTVEALVLDGLNNHGLSVEVDALSNYVIRRIEQINRLDHTRTGEDDPDQIRREGHENIRESVTWAVNEAIPVWRRLGLT